MIGNQNLVGLMEGKVKTQHDKNQGKVTKNANYTAQSSHI